MCKKTLLKIVINSAFLGLSHYFSSASRGKKLSNLPSQISQREGYLEKHVSIWGQNRFIQLYPSIVTNRKTGTMSNPTKIELIVYLWKQSSKILANQSVERSQLPKSCSTINPE